MVKHSLPQTIECAEKHAEFISENYHEVLEKLDTISLDKVYETFLQLGPAIDEIVNTIYTIKILLYRYEKKKDKNILQSVLSIIRTLRAKVRNVRKRYQLVKEILFKTLSEYVESFDEKIESKEVLLIKATLIELKYGRRNLYALESHLTDIQKHILNLLKENGNQ